MEDPLSGAQDAGTRKNYHMTRGDMGINVTDGEGGYGDEAA